MLKYKAEIFAKVLKFDKNSSRAANPTGYKTFRVCFSFFNLMKSKTSYLAPIAVEILL